MVNLSNEQIVYNLPNHTSFLRLDPNELQCCLVSPCQIKPYHCTVAGKERRIFISTPSSYQFIFIAFRSRFHNGYVSLSVAALSKRSTMFHL